MPCSFFHLTVASLLLSSLPSAAERGRGGVSKGNIGTSLREGPPPNGVKTPKNKIAKQQNAQSTPSQEAGQAESLKHKDKKKAQSTLRQAAGQAESQAVGFPQQLNDIYMCPLDKAKLLKMKLAKEPEKDSYLLETNTTVCPIPMSSWTPIEASPMIPLFLKLLSVDNAKNVSHHGWVEPGCYENLFSDDYNDSYHDGFVYRDGDALVGAVEACDEEASQRSCLQTEETRQLPGGKLCFPKFSFHQAKLVQRDPSSRLHMSAVSSPSLKKAGAKQFTWVTDSEAENLGWSSDVDGTYMKKGGYLYELEDGRSVFFQIKLEARGRGHSTPSQESGQAESQTPSQESGQAESQIPSQESGQTESQAVGFPQHLEDIFTCPMDKQKILEMKLEKEPDRDGYLLETNATGCPWPLRSWTPAPPYFYTSPLFPLFLQLFCLDTAKNVSHYGWVRPGCYQKLLGDQQDGFVYRDGDVLVGAVEVCDKEASKSKCMQTEQTKTIGLPDDKFCPPSFQFLPASNIQKVSPQLAGFLPTMGAVTSPSLKKAGAKRFTWVTDSEAEQFGLARDFDGTHMKRGGYLYSLADERLVFFQLKVPLPKQRPPSGPQNGMSVGVRVAVEVDLHGKLSL